MHARQVVWIGLVTVVVGVSATVSAGQGSTQQTPQTKPKVVMEPARPIMSVEGKDLYAAYCASCHGKTGKGDGPAAPALKDPLPDLTTLAKRNGGTYNWAAVEQMISGRGRPVTAHGSVEMPVWGHIFFSMGKDTSLETMRVKNLTRHLESIQVK
jgi:mono/diheme cytochrome c family protein